MAHDVTLHHARDGRHSQGNGQDPPFVTGDDLAAELEAAEERWSEASAHRVTHTVRQTACDGCDASALDEAVAVVWSDGQASTTAPTEEEDVTLTFDDKIGLPTQINLIWDAVDDGDFGFVVEVTGVE